jgi:hypothetical protein
MMEHSSVAVAMGWMARVRFWAGTRYFSVLHSVQTGSGFPPPTYPGGTRGSWGGGGGLKQLEREGDHSPQPSAEVKDGRAIPPLPHASS